MLLSVLGIPALRVASAIRAAGASSAVNTARASNVVSAVSTLLS